MNEENVTREKVITFIESISGYFLINGIDIEQGIALCSSFMINTCVQLELQENDFRELLQKMMDTYMYVKQEFVVEEE